MLVTLDAYHHASLSRLLVELRPRSGTRGGPSSPHVSIDVVLDAAHAVDPEDGLGTICWGSSVPTAVPTSDEACIATLSIVFDSAGAGGTRAGSCTVIAIGNCFGFEGQFAPPAPSPATLRWYHPHAHFTAIGIRRPQFTREAFDVSLDTGP